ncbi:MAG: nitrile hydratase accessory protein [Rhizobiaceae bacterium]|nr:nitrile hydratase accessory protein [Rhizobiaceae bacterium]
MPPGVEEPVFAEPWQAQAFAMVVALHRRGAFTWTEWADALSAEVHGRGAAPDGHDYYEHWLHALEALLVAKNVSTGAEIDDLAAAWERAARATPHGQAIVLENDPQREGAIAT